MASIGLPPGVRSLNRDRELSVEILKLVGINVPVQKFRIEYENGELIKVSIDYFPSIAEGAKAVNHA